MDTVDLAKVIPAAWAARKVLGPTLDAIGGDLSAAYKKGSDLIFKKAKHKIENLDDGKTANLRVTRDVFWNGSFTESDICAEYFSGALASSRSEDGQDDSAIFYLDIIQSLSSTQLHLHYILYNRLNKLLVAEKKAISVGQSTELSGLSMYLSSIELLHQLKIPIERDLVALYKSGLITRYEMSNKELTDEKVLPFTMIVPTTLGIQLYAMSHNKLEEYKSYPKVDFGDFQEIKSAKYYDLSLESLGKQL